MKKILILANSEKGLYNFRRELIEKLLLDGNKVYISIPSGEKARLLVKMGCKLEETSVDSRGMNPFKDIKLLLKYKKLIKEIEPDVVLTYTIKPNIYGGIACKSLNIQYIANITGLGTAVENGGILSKILILMYKFAFKEIKCVFCQNKQNYDFMKEKDIAANDKLKLIPGSGVNLEHFQVEEYPKSGELKFLFIGRIIKEKGIEQYLEMAKNIKSKYENVEFGIVGRCDEEKYKDKIKELENENTIKYYGEQNDVRPFIEKACCIIHPTFYPEGMSNVLLESSAMGRPVITTNRSGCKEIVEDGITGFLVEEKNTQQLTQVVDNFIQMPYEEKKKMGINARRKVENEFDRNIVVNTYMEEISKIAEEKDELQKNI